MPDATAGTSPPGPPTASFVDRLGATWTIQLSPGVLRRVRRDSGLDLAAIAKGGRGRQVFERLSPDRFGQLLWALVQDQATAAEITPEAFARRLHDVGTVRRAGEALVSALAVDQLPCARRVNRSTGRVGT